MQTKPNHGLDWTAETKQSFQKSIVNSGKNFDYVSKEIEKPKGDCQNYYYASFKQMSEYGDLKKLIQKKDILKVCAKCGEDGEFVCCSICTRNYHARCCRYPPLKSNANDWFCNDCDPQDE